MNYKMMGRFIAQTLFIEAVFMLPALMISLFAGEHMAIWGFCISVVIIGLIATVLWLLCRKAPHRIGPREGLVCAAAS